MAIAPPNQPVAGALVHVTYGLVCPCQDLVFSPSFSQPFILPPARELDQKIEIIITDIAGGTSQVSRYLFAVEGHLSPDPRERTFLSEAGWGRGHITVDKDDLGYIGITLATASDAPLTVVYDLNFSTPTSSGWGAGFRIGGEPIVAAVSTPIGDEFVVSKRDPTQAQDSDPLFMTGRFRNGSVIHYGIGNSPAAESSQVRVFSVNSTLDLVEDAAGSFESVAEVVQGVHSHVNLLGATVGRGYYNKTIGGTGLLLSLMRGGAVGVAPSTVTISHDGHSISATGPNSMVSVFATGDCSGEWSGSVATASAGSSGDGAFAWLPGFVPSPEFDHAFLTPGWCTIAS